MGTNKRDPETTKAAILEAAENLFVEKGLTGTTTSEIAKAAGVTKSLIHHYFETKENLWIEVKRKIFGEYKIKQAEILNQQQQEGQFEDPVKKSLKLYFDFMCHNPRVVRILAWMNLEGDNTYCCVDEEEVCLNQKGIESIEKAQKFNLIRNDVPPTVILGMFHALIQGWFSFRRHYCAELGINKEDQEAFDAVYFNNMVRVYLDGLLPR